MAVRLPRELLAEFRAATQRELGQIPYGAMRDRASRVVVERLIREYIASQQVQR